MDVIGSIINKQVVNNISKTSINVEGYTPGLYLYQVISGNKTQSGKMVIE